MELGFCCVGLLGACVFASPPFSGVRSEISQPAPYCHCVMLVCWLFLNFAAFDFGCCLLSANELCGPLSILFQAVAYHLPAVEPSAFPVFVYWKFLAPTPFSSLLTAPCPLCCVFLFSSLLIIQIFFARWGVSLPRGLCWFIPGVAVGILICSPVGLLDVSQVGLELVSGGMGALLFSQCNVAWRSFVWVGGSGCWSFDSSWCFICGKCGSSVSARFLIYRAHICFCTLVAILDPPTVLFDMVLCVLKCKSLFLLTGFTGRET
jgi:hypothetical protein